LKVAWVTREKCSKRTSFGSAQSKILNPAQLVSYRSPRPVSETPALLLHKRFKVNTWDFEMLANVWNFGGFAFELLFSDYRPAFHLGAGDYKRIGNWRSSKPLLLADKPLEMRYLENLSDELQFSSARCSEYFLTCLQPSIRVLIRIATLHFIPHLAS